MEPSRRESVPVARVVREQGRVPRPIPVPFAVRARGVLAPVRAGARQAVVVAFGLWPLTAVLLFGALLLVMAGHNASP
jgi:hypothetical protein